MKKNSNKLLHYVILFVLNFIFTLTCYLLITKNLGISTSFDLLLSYSRMVVIFACSISTIIIAIYFIFIHKFLVKHNPKITEQIISKNRKITTRATSQRRVVQSDIVIVDKKITSDKITKDTLNDNVIAHDITKAATIVDGNTEEIAKNVPNKKSKSSNSSILSYQIRSFVLSIIFSIAIIILSSSITLALFVNDRLNANTIYNGISIDNIDISGMSYDNAIGTKDGIVLNKTNDIKLNVSVDGDIISYDANDFGYYSDGDEIVINAFNYGRIGAWQERMDTILRLRENKVNYEISYMFSNTSLAQNAQKACDLVKEKPIDATMEFDADVDGGFIYTPEKTGRYLDYDMVLEVLTQRCIDMDYTDLTFKTEIVDAKITIDALEEQIVLLSEYTTIPVDEENRTRNIEIAGESVEGIILDGEIFSFNEITGERTLALGYTMAHGIANGTELIDVIAGGICQVSSTIYATILPTDIEIIERYNHSMRSAYIGLGEDATVDYYTKKDLKFKNNTGAPLYLTCTLDWDTYEFSVKLYGIKPNPEIQIKIRTEVLKNLGKPLQESFSNNYSTGSIIIVQKGSSGRVSETFRDYYINGELEKSDLISHDTYKSVAKIVIYGSN